MTELGLVIANCCWSVSEVVMFLFSWVAALKCYMHFVLFEKYNHSVDMLQLSIHENAFK